MTYADFLRKKVHEGANSAELRDLRARRPA